MRPRSVRPANDARPEAHPLTRYPPLDNGQSPRWLRLAGLPFFAVRENSLVRARYLSGTVFWLYHQARAPFLRLPKIPALMLPEMPRAFATRGYFCKSTGPSSPVLSRRYGRGVTRARQLFLYSIEETSRA